MGFTGPPGVGKSTLIGALTGLLRKQERDVAVLSIDPSSHFTRPRRETSSSSPRPKKTGPSVAQRWPARVSQRRHR